MKAMVFGKHGGPEVLQFEELPKPEVEIGEVLVQVRAAALNHLDLWMRRGLPNIKLQFPHISGCEGAGDVVKIGACTSDVNVGDAVVVTPAISCGRCEFCLSNHDSMCPSYGMLGVKRRGCFAEYVSVPAQTLYPKPARLSYEEAASMPLVFLTAWHMLVTRARIAPGEDVLVHAAGSGVGIAAVQIAKIHGARVIATASTDEKLRRAQELGADVLINYSKQDFAEETRSLTKKRGVDIIVEHTGAANWEKNILSLARNGRLITCGATSGPNVQLDLRYIYSRQLSIIGSYMGGREDMRRVFQFINEGKLRPVIDSVFPLRELAVAEKKMEDRNVFGKIIMKM